VVAGYAKVLVPGGMLVVVTGRPKARSSLVAALSEGDVVKCGDVDGDRDGHRRGAGRAGGAGGTGGGQHGTGVDKGKAQPAFVLLSMHAMDTCTALLFQRTDGPLYNKTEVSPVSVGYCAK